MLPPVRYVKTSDGYSIAYAVSGKGRPFVLLPKVFEHVQLAWQFPKVQPWLEGLATRFQLIQIDERGAGMSSRGLREDHALEHYALDMEAVVEELDPGPLVIYAGVMPRVAAAVHFALAHPERVAALVLGVPLTKTSGAALFKTLAEENWDLFLRSIVSLSQAPEDVAQSVALLKQAFAPADFALRQRVVGPAQASPETLAVVGRLNCPVLILHPRDYAQADASDATLIAQMAGATMVVIDGSFALGDAEQGIRAIEAFLADLPATAPGSPRAPETNLSARELEVIRLLAAGKSNQQIADELVIAQNTVVRHVSNILDKTNSANRAEAAVFAMRHGLL